MKKYLFIPIALVGLIGVGCIPNLPPASPQTTNAVSRATDRLSVNLISENPLPDVDGMRLILVSELSKNSSAIALGRGLYFFRTGDHDELEVISSYLREHTNLVAVAMFTASDNHSQVWYAGDMVFNFQHLPQSLSVSNGAFAVLRDR